MPFARLSNGASMYYLSRGPADAPAVVLIHGFPLDATIWKGQLEGLGEKYRIVAPDLRGFGLSQSTQAFTMESLAEDLDEFIWSLRLSKPMVGGLSMGGYVALEFARKYPADACGLILVDTRAEGDSPDAKQGRAKMIQLAREQGSGAVAQTMMGKLLAPQTAAVQPQLVERLRGIMEACPPPTIQNALVAMRDRPDQTANLAAIHMPVLIVVGESDVLTPPPLAQAMHAAIGGSEMAVIRQAGHMSPMEQPRQFNAVLSKFLDQWAAAE